MDDFVCEKLHDWGLSELMELFTDQGINKESLFYLEDKDVDKLIPKMGPRIIFKKRLKELQGQPKEDTSDLKETMPSTSNGGKRKLDIQGLPKAEQPTEKRQRESSSPAAEAKVLTDVKNIMNNVIKKLQNEDPTDLIDFLMEKIRALEEDKRELVGVFGKSGAGKTSLINAVIGVNKLLPSGDIEACTSVMIKVEANTRSQEHEAEIEFISKEDWEDELRSRDRLPENYENREDEDDIDHDLKEKLSALYGEEWRDKSSEQLMDRKYFREIPEFLDLKKKVLICETAKDLSEKLVTYTRSSSHQGESNEVKRFYWPLVKCVTVRVPHNKLLQHVTLVDLPGNGDRNKTRDKMWKEIIGNCSTVWIVTEVNRAAAEKESWEILKGLGSQLGNGGECRHVHFICTKCDVFDDSHDQSAAAVQNVILKRNSKAKEAVIKEFNKLTTVKKHFTDGSFQVFTVSSKEFLKSKHLSSENTEIPKLQEFLQNLNDSHSETLNYVSGARGILSLMHGAFIREAAGRNEDVSEELKKIIKYQADLFINEMNKIYSTFHKCLSKGVEESKKSCSKILKKFLYPRKSAGFHSTLKSVVKNDGVHKPKKRREINLNMKLNSILTGKIDDEFRKTFPNDGKCNAFNGIIDHFSLHTDNLKLKYKDVELQLIFLKTEEEKMKTKLSKMTRDKKKSIYTSLTKTIEEAMHECYEKAALFSGKNTLHNMRETIMEHVQDSKNTMYEKAKEVMLGQLLQLMESILRMLEQPMMKSTDVSLSKDDCSIPDVSRELEVVEKIHNGLKGSMNEDEH